MSMKLTYLVSVCLLLAAAGMASAEVVITTADGQGADTYLANDGQSNAYGPTTTHGSDTSLRAFRQLADTRSKAAFIRFDLGGPLKNVDGATLTFDLSYQKGGGSTVSVYGLIDGDGDFWDEETTSYNTAPGVIPNPPTGLGNCVLDMTQWTLLGTLTSPAAPGTFPLQFSSDPADLPLTEFLEADTNGMVTFIFLGGGGDEGEVASKEHDTYNPPTLTMPNAARGAKTSAGCVNPPNGSEEVPRDDVLIWTPGAFAATHNVYLSTNFSDVNDGSSDALVEENLAVTEYDPVGNLAYGQTYYWRIDEVNSPADPGVYPGPVWSFTTEAYSYLVPDVSVTASAAGMSDPNNLVNDPNAEGTSIEDGTMWNVNPGDANEVLLDFDLGAVYRLDEMLVWNFNLELEGQGFLNFSVKDIAVESSVDGETWTTLGDYTLTQGTGTADNPGQPVKLEKTAAQYVRLIAKNTYGGGVFGLSEVHFYYIPTQATEPEPASGTEDLDPAVTLSWRSGREAVSHRVYLDTDPNAVADETTSFTTSNTDMLDAGAIGLGQTYYWKVVEVNEAETPAAWPSEVWEFSTKEFISVDDFESYTDEPGEEVFVVWPDGYGIGNNGSQVTYDNPPYMESTIVHGGSQSMPYHYGMSGATNSEATMTVGGADWTFGDAKTLVLYFYGDLQNDPATLYVKINNQKITFSDSSALTTPWWTQWNIDLTALGSAARNVSTFTIGVDGPGEGLLFIDDIRLYRTAPAGATEQLWIEAESATSLPAPWQTLSDPEASGGQYIIAPDTATASTDAPSTSDLATYQFTVSGGQYRIWFRLGPIADGTVDSFWVRVPGAEIDPAGNEASPGWIQDNNLSAQPGNAGWHWGPVWDAENGNQPVTFTLPAGTYTLEISYRELQVPLDWILITDDLGQ